MRLRDNLFTQFSLISLVAMAVISAVLVIILSNAVRSSAIEGVVSQAEADVSEHLLASMAPEDFQAPMTGERYDRFHAFIERDIAHGLTARVKLWSTDGTIVYSSDRAAVGQSFPDNENLLTALRGENSYEITEPDGAEHEQERSLETLIEVYTPVVFPGATEPQGVFEIYRYYEPTARLISTLRGWVIGAVGVGFLILYVALVGNVWRGWRTITIQRMAVAAAAEQLRNSEARTRAIVDTATDGVITIDEQGAIESLNPAAGRMFGYTPDEAVRRGIARLMPERFREAHWLSHSRAVQDGHSRLAGATVEVAGLTKDGGEFPMELSLSSWQAAGETFFTAIVRDITERKGREEALAASEARYRALVDNAIEGITVAQDGITVFANRSAAALSGNTVSELIGKPVTLTIHPDDRGMVIDRHHRRVRGEDVPPVYPFRLVDKDGGARWVEIHSVAIDWDGRPATLNFLSDITEQKQADEALRESEETYRTLVDLGGRIDEAVIMLQDTRDGDAIQTFVGDGWPRMTGYSKKELIGKPFFDLLSPRYRQESLRRHKKKMGGETMPGLFEMSIVRQDGVEVPIELASAATTYRGKAVNVAFIRDITERKQAEQNLRAYLEGAPDAVYIHDLEGVFLYGNRKAEELIGYRREELLGRSVLELNLVPEQYVTRVAELLTISAKGEPTSAAELQLRRKDGSLVWSELNTTTIRQGERLVVVGFVRDITDRKEVERRLAVKAKELEEANVRLQEMDRFRSVFLASMSHELRTPLNAIIGFTSIILQGMAGEINHEQREQLSMVKSSADHLLSLINDVLDISKIEAGKVEISVEYFGLDDVVDEVLQILSPMTEEKGLEVVRDVPEGVVLSTDRRRLKQILLNLASNAAKFTDQGSVRIAGRIPGDGQLEIRVIDTGTGIRKEDMSRLFAPFQQVDASLTKKREGTGLGLYHSKKLAELLGGSLSATSQYGKGSEFLLRVPLRHEGGRGDEKSTAGGGQRGQHLLVPLHPSEEGVRGH